MHCILCSSGWVLFFSMDSHTCIKIFLQKKIQTDPPKSAAPCITPNWQKWLWNVNEIMVWQFAGYIFLKSETKFETPDQKALIWDPAIVYMIKTQLIIRQNVNKVKIQIFLLFFNCGLVLFIFLALGVQKSVLDFVPFLKKVIFFKI